MQPLLTQLLNLPGIEVEDFHDLGEQIIIEVEATTEKATCPQRGQESCHLHQNHRYLARDLSISQRQVFLKVNRRQFKCLSPANHEREELDFIGRRRKHTDRFAKSNCALLFCIVIRIPVALNNDLTDEEVWSMVKYLSKKNDGVDLSHLKRLGIDEIALRKGQENFVVVLVDLDCHRLIGMVESRASVIREASVGEVGLRGFSTNC